MNRILILIAFLGILTKPAISQQALSAQNQASQQIQQIPEDRLLRLISANSAEVIQKDGKDLRKVSGPAQFLHNNTYIICDTAVWDVLSNTLDAKGNVQIIQNQTSLKSDFIHYIANESLAQVRGNLVELLDKEKNLLRTNFLDFYTKDSIGYFYEGGSVLDKSKNYIESMNGSYDAKLKKFKFYVNVRIKADSVIMKTDSVAYETNKALFTFLGKVHAWRDSSYLRADNGWYNRENEQFNFYKNAYIYTKDQEVWADDIFYDRNKGFSILKNNIQIVDTSQSTMFFADSARYVSKPMSFTLYKDPSAAYYSVEEGKADTLFLRADTLKYYSKAFSEIDSATVAQAKERVELSAKDPFQTIVDAIESNKKRPSSKKAVNNNVTQTSNSTKTDVKQEAAVDSLSAKNLDTLSVPTPKVDSVKKFSFSDTTTIRFVQGFHNVKMHISNIQGLCDSLVFSSLDSMARLYGKPILWNEENQFTADSMQFVVSGKSLTKAELLSSAYVISKEDSVHFNQIKSTDIIGYFKKNDIYRFDALGGVSLMFFIEEDSVITTMNQKECRVMKGLIKDRKIQKIQYVQDVKSDAFPVYNLPINKQRLKGFNWSLEKRPKDRFAVCKRRIKLSEKAAALKEEKPIFPYTRKYFGKQAGLK
ncbi:MAG: OstA-like protein [Bacteroidales bacterium]